MNNKGVIVIDAVAICAFIAFFSIVGTLIKKDTDRRRLENTLKIEPEDRLLRTAKYVTVDSENDRLVESRKDLIK